MKDEMNEFKTILNTNLDIKPFKLTQPRPRSIPVPEKVSLVIETRFILCTLYACDVIINHLPFLLQLQIPKLKPSKPVSMLTF